MSLIHGSPKVVNSKMPRTLDDLRDWIRQRLALDLQTELDLVTAIEEVLARQRQLVEESKTDAIQALNLSEAAN